MAKDVAEIATILGATPSEQSGAEATSEETSAIGTGGDLFGGPAEESGTEAQPAGYMFAAFDAAAGGAEAQESAQESSGGARGQQAAAPQKMTGQRNENSVLFSLGNLQQLAAREPAAGAAEQPASAPPRAAAPASGEGSGLIDIRALAQATGAEGQRAAAADDLLNLGANLGGAGTLGGPLLGPAADEKSGRGPWIWVGGGAVSLLLVAAIAILGFVVFQKDSAPEAQFEVKGDSGATPTVDPGRQQADSPTAAAQMPADRDTAEPTVELDESEEPAEEALAEAPAEAPSTSSAKEPAKRSSKRRSSARKASAPKPAQASAPAPKAKSSNLDALMDEVIGGSSAKTQKKSSSSSSSGSNLPAAPSRDDVKRALTGVSGAVRGCKKGDSGTALVSVTFSGSTGRASKTKVVSGPFKGTPVGACIEKAAKRARVPRFKQSTFNVKFPYRL